jgi:hypothetical protein
MVDVSVPPGFDLIEQPAPNKPTAGEQVPAGFEPVGTLSGSSIGSTGPAGNAAQPGALSPADQHIVAMVQGREEPQGPADYLNLLWQGYKGSAELGLTGLTGAFSYPASGIAGLAKTITSGPEAGAQTISEMQKALTYEPKGVAVPAAIGEAMHEAAQIPGVAPAAKFAVGLPKTLGDLSYEGALGLGMSPDAAAYFGAAGKSAIPIAINLLGLKGSKAAKTGLMRKLIEREGKEQFYDTAGNLLKDVKDALAEQNIKLKELEDFLPEHIDVKSAAREQVEQIKGAASARLGATGKMAELIEKAKINPEIMAAAKEFGVESEILPQYASENPIFRAVSQGLSSIPASQMSAQEKAVLEELGARADDLITEFGGQIDKSLLSDEFRTRSEDLIKNLAEKSDEAYAKVNQAIAPRTPADTTNIVNEIKSIADELGGTQYLDKSEQRLLEALDPKTHPTYARLDKYRREIGAAMEGMPTQFRNADHASLSRLYSKLTQDQEGTAQRLGVGELYKTAKNLIVERKGIENQLISSLGKRMQYDITNKAKLAIVPLMKGNVRKFDDFLANIPEQLGPQARREIVASSLNEAFSLGSRKQMSLHVPGFDNWMNGLKRNAAAYKRVETELGPDAMRRLDSFHTLIHGIRRAQEEGITTGRTLAVPGMFDETENIASKLYGTGKKIAAAEGISTSVGLPGAGTTGVIGHLLSASKTKRSIAADELLASPKFRNLMKEIAAGRADTATKVENLEKLIEKIKTYQNWKKTIPPDDLKDLATVGAVGYLVGPGAAKKNN